MNLRSAEPTDITAIFNLIKALAEYEKLSHTVQGNEKLLEAHLFGPRPYAEAIVAETGSEPSQNIDKKIVGFALFFPTYSTFLTKPGLHLEDLFVLPEYRGKGIGKAMIKYLAKLTVDRDYGRLEWTVLDWNQSAIDFYKAIGADILPDWRICRVTGESLLHLSQ